MTGHEHSSHPTRIGICADDFGLNESINDAVLQLVDGGRLSAVSCMVDGPAWAGGATALRAAPADLGLHLNFTEPLQGAAPVFSLRAIVMRSYLGHLDPQEILSSIERQLSRFEDVLGRAPDFVDGHQHVHQLPIVRDALISVLTSRYPSRPWLRSTALGDRPAVGLGIGDRLKARLIALLGSQALQEIAYRFGFPTNRALMGVYGFTPQAGVFEAYLGHWLSAAGDGDLLMCHPGCSLVQGDPIAAARTREFEVLAGKVFETMLQAHRIAVVRLSDLLNKSPNLRNSDGTSNLRAGVA
ncbi:hypothetical protein ALISP_1892 [Alicycliphilus sp. B1]|nr:hypothetical protein ALISP_1892 [Alicycliphilus sp. B1]